jgi:hypothetical protein
LINNYAFQEKVGCVGVGDGKISTRPEKLVSSFETFFLSFPLRVRVWMWVGVVVFLNKTYPSIHTHTLL